MPDTSPEQLQDVSPGVPEVDLGEALNALTDLVLRVVDADACGVARLPKGDEALRMCTDRDAPDGLAESVCRLHAEGLTNRAFRTGRPVLVPDEPSPGAATVLAPLTVQKEPMGLLVVRFPASAEASDADLDLIDTLARQAEIAFANATLYQDLLVTHQKLKSSQAQLVQSGKLAAVGQLAAGVAHEVNNPLQIILSRVQLMMMRHRELKPLVKDLHLIESNVKRISRIIRSLLDFARHNTGEEEWRRIDLIYLITQTVNLMQHLMEKADVEVEVSHPSGEPLAIQGNVGEVEQIFLNLLINARQAMPNGGRIGIDIQVEGDTVVVRVSDTGEGIPEAYLERIFDPFFTTREEDGGTGLGLSIIYGIVEKHNGRIEVESTEGIGTTFELRLPIDPT